MGGPPHIMASSGPRMSPHMQQHNRISGPMRVMDMSGQSPHGMVMGPNQMQMGGMMGGRHDMPMNPGMMSVNHPHGSMGQMGPMGGSHQYMNHPHHHAVGPGNHPGMHSMMGGPGGGGMHHQTAMGPGTAPGQGMMNMAGAPNAVGSQMGQAPPPHGHMRPGMNVMMHSSGPRPQTSGMPTGELHHGWVLIYCCNGLGL